MNRGLRAIATLWFGSVVLSQAIPINDDTPSVRKSLAPRATNEPVLPNVSISVAGGAPTGPLPRISSITIPGASLPTFDSSSIKATCPQYNHTVIKTPSGQLYDMECGTDYYGGDIQGSNPAINIDYESCLDACDALPNCVAVSYKPIGGNINFCYLKEKVESGTPNLAIWGGRNVERAHLVLPEKTRTTSSMTPLTTSSTSSPSLEVASSSLSNKAEATSSNSKPEAFPSIASALSPVNAAVSGLSSADLSSTFSASSGSTLSRSSSDPVLASSRSGDALSSSSSVSHLTSTTSSEDPVETGTGVLSINPASTRIAINTEAHGPETWSHPVASAPLVQTRPVPSLLLVPSPSSSPHVSRTRSHSTVSSASGFKTLWSKPKSSAVPTQSTGTTPNHRSAPVEWHSGWDSVFHSRSSSHTSHSTRSAKHVTDSVHSPASSTKQYHSMTQVLHNKHVKSSIWVPSAPWPAWPPTHPSQDSSSSRAYQNPSTTFSHPDCPTTCPSCPQESTTVPARLPSSTVYTDVTNYVTIHEPTTVTVHHSHSSPTTTTEYITVTEYSTLYKAMSTTVWAHAQTTVTIDPSYQWNPSTQGESTVYGGTSTTVQVHRPTTVIRDSELPITSPTLVWPSPLKHTSFPVPTEEPSGFDSEDQGFTNVRESSVPVIPSDFPEPVKATEPTSAPLPWGLIPDAWPGVISDEYGFPSSGDPFKLTLPHLRYDKSVQKAQSVRSVPRSESDTYTFHYDVPGTYTDETTQDQEPTLYISVPDLLPTSSDVTLLEPVAKNEVNSKSSDVTYEFDYDVPILYTATIFGEEIPVSTTEIQIPNNPPNAAPAEPVFTDAIDVQKEAQVTQVPPPSLSSNGWYTFSYRTPISYTTSIPCRTCAGGMKEVVTSIDAITIHDPLLGAPTAIPSSDDGFAADSAAISTAAVSVPASPSSDDGWMDWIPSIPTTGVNAITPVPIRVVESASQVDETTPEITTPVSAPSAPTSKSLSQPSSSVSEPVSSAAATPSKSELSGGAVSISPSQVPASAIYITISDYTTVTPTTSTTTTVDLSSGSGVEASKTTVPVTWTTVIEHTTSTRTITSTSTYTVHLSSISGVEASEIPAPASISSDEHPQATGEPTRTTMEYVPEPEPTTHDDASPTVSTPDSASQPVLTASALFKTFAISGYSGPESTLTVFRTATVAPTSSAKPRLPKSPIHKSAGTGLKISMAFVTIVATLVGIVLAVY